MIVTSFNEIRWLALPLALRGSVVASWVSVAFLVGTSLMTLTIQTKRTLQIIITVSLVISVLATITIIVAGIDITRAFTSPITLTEHLGDGFAQIVTKGRYTPKSLKGSKTEPVVKTATEVGTAIVISTLISFLPYPYNVVLFFMYYKFLTALVFCIIPFGLSVWCALYVLDYFKELKDDGLTKNMTEDTTEYSEDSFDREAEPLVRHHRRANFIPKYPSLDNEEKMTWRQNSKTTVLQGI